MNKVLGSEIRVRRLREAVGCDIGPLTVLTEDQVYDIAAYYNDRCTSREQAYTDCLVDCALASLTYTEAEKVMDAVNQLIRLERR